MPSNIVKPGEEDVWESAKNIAKKQTGKKQPFALANFIFQKMKKKKKKPEETADEDESKESASKERKEKEEGIE